MHRPTSPDRPPQEEAADKPEDRPGLTPTTSGADQHTCSPRLDRMSSHS